MAANNIVINYFRLGRPQKYSPIAKPALAAVLALCIAALIFLASAHMPPEERYRPIVEKYAPPRGMETELVLAVIAVESRGRPRVVSPKGAIGLMQLLPATAREMAEHANVAMDSDEDLFDPELNIRLGVLYLSQLMKRYDNDTILALGAYNAGPRRIKEWKSKHPELTSAELWATAFFPVTKKYVIDVQKRKQTY